MTSNCIIDPDVGDYKDRIWTRSIVGWPGAKHLVGDDFSAMIAQAQSLAGFPYTEIEHKITVGFGRQTLLGAADAVIDLVSQKNYVTYSLLVVVMVAVANVAIIRILPVVYLKIA